MSPSCLTSPLVVISRPGATMCPRCSGHLRSCPIAWNLWYAGRLRGGWAPRNWSSKTQSLAKVFLSIPYQVVTGWDSHVKMFVFCLTFRKNHVCLIFLHSTEKIIAHIGMLSVDRITSEISSVLSAARSWDFSISSCGLARYPLNFRPYSGRSLFLGLDQTNVWLSPVYTSRLPIVYSVSLS
jgi:hypothetical protein